MPVNSYTAGKLAGETSIKPRHAMDLFFSSKDTGFPQPAAVPRIL